MKTIKLMASVLTLAIGIGFVWCLYLQTKINTVFFNADSIFLAELYRDVWLEGHSLGDWFLPPAPSFFPDWILYFISRSVTGSWFLAWPLLGSLQLLMMALLAVLIYRRIAPGNTSWAWIASGWIALLAANNVEPFLFSLLTIYHFGSFLVLLGLLYLMVRSIEDRSNVLDAVLALLVSVATFSDRLIVIQFLFPLLAILAFDSRRPILDKQNRKAMRRYCLIAFVATVVGALAYKIIIPHPTLYDARLGFQLLPRNLSTFANNFWDVAIRAPLALVLILTFYAIAVSELSSAKKRPLEIRALIIVFSLASSFVTFITLSLFSNIEIASRYWIPILLLPLLLIPIASRSRSKIALLKLAGVAWTLIANTAMALRHPTHFRSDHRNEFVSCMDDLAERFNLHSGVAGYWDTKPIRLFTKRHLAVASYRKENGRLRPFNWITSVGWTSESYDFAVIFPPVDSESFTKEDLNAIGAKPTYEQMCDDRLILIYKDAPLRFSTADGT